MYGTPSAPEHIQWMEQNKGQKSEESKEPELLAPNPPAPPSQPTVAAPKKPVAPPTFELPLHRKNKGKTVAPIFQEQMQASITRTHEGDTRRDDEYRASQAQYLKEAKEKGLSEDAALDEKTPKIKCKSKLTKTTENGRQAVDQVEVTDLLVPEGEADEGKKAENKKADENKKAAPKPADKPPRAVVFPNDASNARLKESQDAKKAQQLREINASAAKPPVGPSKTENKPSAPADKAPSYYREWYRGKKGNACRMSATDENFEVDEEQIQDLWDRYFCGIELDTGLPFEVRIPAKRSKFFFGPQGNSIAQIRGLCLTPIRFHTCYVDDWLYIGLLFPKSSRVPHMAMLQMYAILHDWSVTPEHGLFFDQKMSQDIEATTLGIASGIIRQMDHAENSAAAQEAIKARKEEERLVREQEKLAKKKAEELRQEQLAKKKQEKKQWLLEMIDSALEEFPNDTEEVDPEMGVNHKMMRSKTIRTIVKILAVDEGLYSKDVGLTESDAWAIVTDHWSKTRPKQAAEAQALMYGSLPRT